MLHSARVVGVALDRCRRSHHGARHARKGDRQGMCREHGSVTPVQVRPAQPQDVPPIAALLVEGFGQHYGGVLDGPAGQHLYTHIYQLRPERLHSLIVAIDNHAVPVGLVGLRTRDMPLNFDHSTLQVMRQELGIARVILYHLWVRLTIPPPYPLQQDEAYVHSLTITARWRGQGVATVLLDHLHATAYERGKTTVVVQVAEGNTAARRLYERHGYTLRQRRPGPLAKLAVRRASHLLLEKHVVGIPARQAVLDEREANVAQSR